MEIRVMEVREVTELEAATEILKDIKRAADRGMMWRNPDHYPDEYRKNYEAVVSRFLGVAIPALEGLAQEDKRYRDMDELEKKTLAALSEAMSDIPDNKKEYLLGYAEAVADMKKKEE